MKDGPKSTKGNKAGQALHPHLGRASPAPSACGVGLQRLSEAGGVEVPLPALEGRLRSGACACAWG